MSIKTKNAGAYADIVGVFHKRAGAYSAVQGVFAKSGGAYGRVDGGGGAYRYWRVKNLAVAGTYFEVSELQLCVNGVRQVGTISVSTPGGYNDIGRINDNDLNSREFWAIVNITPDFWISFDFSVPVAIDGVKQGGFDSSNRIATSMDVYGSSDNSTWVKIGSVGPFNYPGNNTLSSPYPIGT